MNDRLFAEQLLAVIDEGQRLGTHKLLVLLALIDTLSQNLDTTTAKPPSRVHLDDLADNILEILWPQVRPYVAPNAEYQEILSQSSDANSKFIRAASDLREAAIDFDLGALHRVRKRLPSQHRSARARIRSAAIAQPLHRLQYVRGKVADPFLYDWPWTDPDNGPSLTDIKRRHGGELILQFRPGAAEALLRYAPLVRPLIETTFVRDVARFNGLNTIEEDLYRWLFGSDRVTIPAELKGALFDHQEGVCFYHRKQSPIESLHIDHFLPYRRHRLETIENFVLACEKCNSSKSDQYAYSEHLERWRESLEERANLASLLGPKSEVTADPARTLSYARTGYFQLPIGAPLWTGPTSDRSILSETESRAINQILADPPSATAAETPPPDFDPD